MIDYLLVNFGGPRHLGEIESFLKELLFDRDVIRTNLPSLFHRYLFRRIAKRRAEKIRPDYQRIGGKSPIYFDTENLAKILSQHLQRPLFTFHRYLPAMHIESLQKIEASSAAEIRVLPLFPQFSYATAGSIARFFSKHLKRRTVQKLRWIKSYPSHPAFIAAFQKRISFFLQEQGLAEEETILLFSAHGLPADFVATGDPYASECELSYQAILKAFPRALGRLAYQSQFGPGEWLRPYTNEIAEQILEWSEGRVHIVFVPLSFISDHIETLFEIEHLYLPLIRKRGLNAFRCPALNLELYWIEALLSLFQETRLFQNDSLIRPFAR